jgi:hypothetical protein
MEPPRRGNQPFVSCRKVVPILEGKDLIMWMARRGDIMTLSLALAVGLVRFKLPNCFGRRGYVEVPGFIFYVHVQGDLPL